MKNKTITDSHVRILVVDGDPYYLEIIPAALTQDGTYAVLTASTGFDAGLIVAEHRPHVVILDIHLPDIDGRMVCERIRAHEGTVNTRILAVSSYIEEEEVSGLSTHGFDDFLRKPFQTEELKVRVAQLLQPLAAHTAQ